MITKYSEGNSTSLLASLDIATNKIMKEPYLEVTFRRGLPLAAYLYLPREAGEKSCRTSSAEPGMVIDFGKSGNPIGIEITAPTKITTEDLNAVLTRLGLTTMKESELAPLRAA